ncbi:conserved hypothetical protein [Tenacibaculum litopenaei]|uniref:T9SS type A sorting domain-containing protein n=1 Tax=Tenacibaculum litopenaei TaxID=396016 RepID=UPI003893CE7D
MKKTNTFIPFFVGLLIPMLELEAQEQLDCEFNFREALYYLKLNDNSEENTLKITEYLTPCVEKGDDKAQLLMARFYLRSGSERDDEKAYKLLEKSAEQGNMIAAGDLGAMYKYGKGCDLNLTKAKKWFKKAAEAGNQKAIYSLGYLSLKGLGNIQQDYQQAIHWFEKSNYPMAKYWLGICYYHGYGVEKNIPKANQYLGANFENQPSNTRSTENTINDSESKYQEIENNEDSNQPTENITEGDVIGKWSGVLLKYDWSGKHIEQKVPIAINFKGETDEAFATYMLTIGEQKVEGYFNIIENAIDFDDLSFNMPHTSFLETIPNKLSYEIISGNLTKKTVGNTAVLIGNLDSFIKEFNEVGAPMKFVIEKKQQFTNTDDEISDDILEALATQEENCIKLYPNPFVNDLIISYTLENPSTVEVRVTDIYGAKSSVVCQREDQLTGKHSYFFEGSHLKKGTYVVSVTINNERKTRIIVKK